MKYLLDTCAISHFVKGHPQISAHLKACSPELISISSVSIMEIEYGLQLNTERAKLINSIIESLISIVHVLPFEHRDAKVAGSLRAELKKSGTPIGHFDLLIGAQALSHGLTLVTQNTSEFQRIPLLALEDWLT